MAEFIFKNIVAKNGCEEKFIINSAATSTEEIGNGIHQGTKRILLQKDIPYSKHYAVQMTRDDYDEYDLLIGMDSNNIRNMNLIAYRDSKNKIKKLLEFCNQSKDVADPWYTGNFDETYDDILRGCLSLFDYCKKINK